MASSKSTAIDRNKSSATDLTEENTSKRNPEKDDSTIPEGSTLIGLTHTFQDTILLQSALVDGATGLRKCQARLLIALDHNARLSLKIPSTGLELNSSKKKNYRAFLITEQMT